MAETAAESDVQSTEITFKTITQDVFKMTFPLSTTVTEIKAKIFSDKGDDFEVERQKLIYNGKVLNDTQTLQEVNVDEKKYIVVMVSKVGPYYHLLLPSIICCFQKKVEQPVVAQSSSSANVEPAKTEAPASESTPTPSASVAPTPAAPIAARTFVLFSIINRAFSVTPEQEETITMVSAMGYPRDEVIRALRAAFW